MIEGAGAPWQMDRKASWEAPVPVYNPASKVPYRGINSLLLESQGRDDPRWMTEKQAEVLGGEVRPGQKPAAIEYTTFGELVPVTGPSGVPVLEADGLPVYREARLDEPKTFLCHVYNGAQVDGLEPFERQFRSPGATLKAGEGA